MKKVIDRIVGGFLIILMMAMTLDVLWGVLTRYAFGNQASWSEELARFLLIWIGILGAGYAAGQRLHLAIELLKPKLTSANQIRLETFISILVIIFAFTVLVIGGLRLIYITQILGQLSPALRIPMSVVYSVLPISGVLILYYKVDNLMALRRLRAAIED